MRIALLTELYAPSVGGQELFFEGIAHSLIAAGHQVDVFCIGHLEGLPTKEVIGGVPIQRWPIAPTYMQPTMAWSRRSLRAMIRYAMFTRSIARQRRHDVYLLNQWPLLHVPFLPRYARRRAILHWCEIRTGRFHRLIQAMLPRLVARNVAISRSVASEIERVSGRQVGVLPSGIDLASYHGAPHAQRSGLLSLGRLAPHKNLPFLVSAFDVLKQGGYAGKLTIAGGGPFEAELRQVVAASAWASDIDILGQISDQQKYNLLAENEILVMPSQREGFPRVVAEAMASGMPTVTVDYPENGTKDVVAAYACGVVTGPTVEQFALGVNAASADWVRLSQAGLGAAQGLNWPLIAQDFVEMAEHIAPR